MIFAGLTLLPPFVVAETHRFDIASGDALVTLEDFSRQSDVQILFNPDEVAGQHTVAVVGKLDPKQALTRMLSGTALTFAFSDRRTVAIVPRKKDRSGVSSEASVVGPLPLALGPKLPPFLPEVSVTAQRARGDLVDVSGVAAQNFSVADLDIQGIETPMDWLRTVPENFGGGATEDTHAVGLEAPTNTAFGTGANLRGLGSRATLILVDGRRLAPSGSAGTFTDVADIPLSAVDHIQIVDAGVAPLYGSDAIAGVINFVLRDESAPETRASYGGLTRGSLGEQLYSQSFFQSWSGVSLLLTGEYYERDALPASARAQATSDLTSLGGQDFDIPYGNPGTLVDATGQTWAIPAVPAGGHLTPSQLVAGTQNLYDRYQNATVLPQQERWSFLATLDAHVDPDTTVYVDALFSRRQAQAQASGLTAMLSVPGNNPFAVRPDKYVDAPGDDSIDVLYGFGNDLGPLRLHGTVDSGQLVVGLQKELPARWSLNAYAGYALERQDDVEQNLVNFTQLQKALDDLSLATSFDAFGGSNASSVAYYSLRSTGSAHYDSAYVYSDLSAVHPLFSLPGGPATFTVGADFRIQSFASSASPSDIAVNPATDRKRETTAVYTELQAPLLPGRGNLPTTLSLSGGMRYEHYSDVGQVLTPQLGIDYLPFSGWKLQGSWARLYRAPNLPDMTETTNFSTLVLLPDPTASHMTNTLVWSGGNADLKPETARNWSLGLTWAPGNQPRVSTSLSYFNVVFQNRITDVQNLPLDALSNPQYLAIVDRDVTQGLREQVCSRSTFVGLPQDCLGAPIGAVIDLRLRNLDTLRTDGVDFRNLVEVPIAGGLFKLTTSATYLLHYMEQDTPSSPQLELRNTAHNPLDLYGTSNATFDRKRFWLSASVNYQSAYEDNDSIPPRPVSSWTTIDAAIGWRVHGFGGDAAPTEISLSGQNLCNRGPPFLNNVAAAIGYDQENGDLLGRRVNLTLRQRW